MTMTKMGDGVCFLIVSTAIIFVQLVLPLIVFGWDKVKMFNKLVIL